MHRQHEMGVGAVSAQMGALLADEAEHSQQLSFPAVPHALDHKPQSLVGRCVLSHQLVERIPVEAVQKGVYVASGGQGPWLLLVELAQTERAVLQLVDEGVAAVEEGDFAFEEEVGPEVDGTSRLEDNFVVASPVLVDSLDHLLKELLREVLDEEQLLQELLVDGAQQLAPQLIGELGYHLLLDFAISVPLLVPDELEVGPNADAQLLGDELLVHELVHSHELLLEVRVAGLRLQQNLDDVVEDVREGYARYYEHHYHVRLR